MANTYKVASCASGASGDAYASGGSGYHVASRVSGGDKRRFPVLPAYDLVVQ